MQALKTIAFFLTVVCVAFCLDCENSGAPDGTATALFYSQCDTSKPQQLQINDVTVTYPDGSTDYPINVSVPISIDVKSYNNGPQINNLTANVSLEAWTAGVSSCHWIAVPTFGLLNNLSGCFNCPLAANSDIDLNVVINLAPFAPIISGLLGGNVYGMDIHLKTDPKSTTEIACVHIEAKISK